MDWGRFKNIDLILSAGDLKPQYLSFIVTLIKAPLFYIHGNHDESYNEFPPEGCDSIDGRIISIKRKDVQNESIFKFKKYGSDEYINILGLGGSKRYKYGDHQYSEKEMEKRIKKLWFSFWRKKKIDIVLAHSPILGYGDGNDFVHSGYECFRHLVKKYSPKYFIYGHQHLTYLGGKRTLELDTTHLINAYGYYIIKI